VPLERRRFEGLEIVDQVTARGPDKFMPFFDLLEGLKTDIFYENNHVTPHPDPAYSDAYQAPFDRAFLTFKVEDEKTVVRFLQVTFFEDFAPELEQLT